MGVIHVTDKVDFFESDDDDIRNSAWFVNRRRARETNGHAAERPVFQSLGRMPEPFDCKAIENTSGEPIPRTGETQDAIVMSLSGK
jgi:hypothetical protein